MICKKINIVAFGIFLVSLFAQMYISNATALRGKDFQQLHEQKSQLERELAKLEYEDSLLSSLENIEGRARQLGFVDMTEPLLSVSSPSLAALANP